MTEWNNNVSFAIQCNICHALARLKKLYLAVYIIFKMFILYNRKFLLCMLHGHNKGEGTGVYIHHIRSLLHGGFEREKNGFILCFITFKW